ncbi:EF-hand domain-containing protein [Vibrio sp. 10N.286.48.F5]|uniref:EF-hand domain-containing protein n=1 Tax=Vibrio sp. 10N.286.48.F5 TaxID=3229699 RepID=UPI00354DDD77
MKIKSTIIALLGIVIAFGAMAGEMNKGMNNNMSRPVFSQFDLDGDGKITEAEFNQARSERIAQRAEEGRTLKNINQSHSFASLDSNADRAISQQEFNAHQGMVNPKNTMGKGKNNQ